MILRFRVGGLGRAAEHGLALACGERVQLDEDWTLGTLARPGCLSPMLQHEQPPLTRRIVSILTQPTICFFFGALAQDCHIVT